MNTRESFSSGHSYEVMASSFSVPHKAEAKCRGENTIKDKKRKAKLKIDNFYHLLMQQAIKDQIKKFGQWDVRVDSASGKLDDEVADKYSIQFKSCESLTHSGDFKLVFELTGEIGAVLEKFSMDTMVEATLANQAGEDNYSFGKSGDTKNLKPTYSDLWNSIDTYTLEEFQNIYHKITKPYKFLLG